MFNQILHSLQKADFVKSSDFWEHISGSLSAIPKPCPKGRNVKSSKRETTNFHEKGKDYLSDSEIKTFLEASKKTRYPKRNYLLLLMMYRHGLRASEAIAIKKSDVDLKEARIWINQLKGGLSTENPISGDQLRAVKRYLISRKDNLPWLFINEKGNAADQTSGVLYCD